MVLPVFAEFVKVSREGIVNEGGIWPCLARENDIPDGKPLSFDAMVWIRPSPDQLVGAGIDPVEPPSHDATASSEVGVGKELVLFGKDFEADLTIICRGVLAGEMLFDVADP